jgi:3-dehydroquinate synthase
VYHLPDGDRAKSIRFCEDFWESLLRENVTRQSLIIALGGGAILDFTGFCAATYMRGIPCIYIPTTLLSMVDGSEGGKTGINLYGTKNVIGTFTDPVAIMRNADFLQTLSAGELLSGWAEVIKHSLLTGGTLMEMVAKGMPEMSDIDAWIDLIRENIIFKKGIVAADFKEKGERKLLNLGHTIGHGLEAIHFEDSKINHGISIANGLYWESLLGYEMGYTTKETFDTVDQLVFPRFPKVGWNESDVEPMTNLLMHDKKNYNGKIQLSLLKTVGDAAYNIEISESDINAFLTKYAVALHDPID